MPARTKTRDRQPLRAAQGSIRDLKPVYDHFMEESEPAHKEQTGKDLLRAIFGEDAIAEYESFPIEPLR